MAAELRRAYPRSAGETVLAAVLKGSVPFLADLCRQLPAHFMVDFMAISSYAPDSGRVRIVKDLDIDAYDRNVVVVEDIVDTGLTLTYLRRELQLRAPRSLSTCALLDKAVRRIVPVPLEFRGFEIGDEFVLGYGLDFAGRYRNLDRVVSGELEALRADPDVYRADLFGSQPSR